MTSRSRPEWPLLRGLYHIVPLGPDRVEVCNAGRSVAIANSGAGRQIADVIAAMDGTHRVDELEARFPLIATLVLDRLVDCGLIVEADHSAGGASAAAARLAVVGLDVSQSFSEGVRRLRDATVALAGCGPTGADTAVQIVKAGVGRLLVADDGVYSDTEVAASSVLPSVATRRPRAESVAALCREVCGASTIDVISLNAESVRSADLVIAEGMYTAEGVGAAAADAALALRVPYLVHWQDGLDVVIGPMVRDGGRPCHRCAETRRLSHVFHESEHLAYLRHRSTRAPRSDALVAAHTAIVSGIIASEAIRVLAGGLSTASGAAFVVDLTRTAFRVEPVLPVPGCRGCDPASTPEASKPDAPRHPVAR